MTAFTYEVVTLASGLRVVLVPQNHLWGTSINLFVRVGSRDESPGEGGISHALEHMLFRGCEGLPTPHAVSLAFEDRGGTLNASTHPDFTNFSLFVPSSEVDAALDDFGRLIARPLFEGWDIEQGVLRQELLEDLDENGRDVNVEHALRLLAFPGHPLGLPVGGYLDSVSALTVDDIARWHRKYYRPDNMVLTFAGALPKRPDLERFEQHLAVCAEAALSIPCPVRRLFTAAAVKSADDIQGAMPSAVAGGGALDASTANQRSAAQAKKKLTFGLAEPEKHTHVDHSASQIDLRIAFLGPALDDADLPAVKVLLRILDDGLSTRLYRALCDGSGIAYEAFGALELYEDIGLVECGVTVEPARLSEAVDALWAVLRSLSESPPTAAERDKALRRMRWDFEALRDRPEEVASVISLRVLFGKRLDQCFDFAPLEAVTIEDLATQARRLFSPATAVCATVGRLP